MQISCFFILRDLFKKQFEAVVSWWQNGVERKIVISKESELIYLIF